MLRWNWAGRIAGLTLLGLATSAHAAGPTVSVSFPASVETKVLDGRLILLMSNQPGVFHGHAIREGVTETADAQICVELLGDKQLQLPLDHRPCKRRNKEHRANDEEEEDAQREKHPARTLATARRRVYGRTARACGVGRFGS